MAPLERRHRPRPQSALAAGGWLLLVSAATALCVSLSVPTGWSRDPARLRDVFAPEWVLAATLVVLPVHRAARSCWWFAPALVLLPTLQLTYAVQAAGERLDQAGMSADGLRLWWIVAAVQVLLLTVAAGSGAIGSLRDRRFERFMLRRLGGDLVLAPPGRMVP